MTIADDENVHEGRHDSPLNPEGKAQAAALAAYWTAHPPGFDRAYCSTLQRAHDTARIVTDALGLALTPTDLLREIVAPGSRTAPRLSCRILSA